MAITVTIADTVVSILNDNNAQIDRTIDMNTTAQFTVLDNTGVQHWQPGQPVSITDSSLGLIFSGYIDQVDETNLYPNAANLYKVTCMGTRYLADKRYYNGEEFTNRLAGDIVTEFLSTLKQDRVTGQFVKDHAASYADWSTGILSNTTPSMDLNGCLELAPAGTQINATYGLGIAGAFTPQITKGAQNGNTITCASFNALQYVADCVVPGLSNAYLATKIWSGSHTLVPGDYLTYDVWINSDSPSMQAGVDITCSDGSTFRSTNVATWDNQHIYASPVNSLAGLANNQWYTRLLGLNAGVLVGKTITSISLVFAGNSTGHYVAYFRRIKIFNGGTTIASVFQDTSTATQQLPQIIGNSGYANMLCNVVTAYDSSATLLSAVVLDMTPAKIYKNSIISWLIDIPANCSAVAVASIDGNLGNNAIYLSATNNGAIPGLTPGMNLTGLAMAWFVFLYNNSPDPTVTPVFHSLTFQINPSYQTVKTDYKYKIKTDADYASGVLSSNLKEAGNVLQINGFQANLTQIIPSSTLFGSSGFRSFLNNRTLALLCDHATDVRLRMDFATATWADGIIELDVQVPSDPANNTGFVYRCSNWGTGNNTFAYAASLSSTGLQFGHGVNSTASTAQTYTSIGTATLTLNAGDWHRLKVIFVGSSHQIFLDDSLLITATDATYTAAGYAGVRFYNGSAVDSEVGYVYNFGIASAFSGTWISPTFSLAGVGTVASAFTRTQGAGDASQATLLTEISYDNGSTWQACVAPPIAITNAGNFTYDAEVIPGLAPGTNTASLTTCKLRLTLSVSSVSAHLETNGTLFYVISAYSASGQRVSRRLSITGVDRIGSASLSWAGVEATNTNILVESTLDGITWSTEGSGASGAASISGFNVQPDPVIDSFTSQSNSFYTNTAQPGGGQAGTWYYDTANSRVQASGGVNALYINNTLSINDGSVLSDLDYSNGGGLVLHYIANNMTGQIRYYYAIINDSAATSNPNTIQIYKQDYYSSTPHTFLLAGPTAINFPHGKPHRFIMKYLSGVVSVLMDGAQILSFDDSASFPIPSGQVGLFNASATAEFYQLFIQGLGDIVPAGAGVTTRVTLTSTDPTATPQLTDLAVSIRNGNINDGAIIPSTNYSVLSGSTNTIAQDLDDMAKQSNTLWWIGDDFGINFQNKLGQPAPWIATGDTIIASSITVSNVQSGYRNVKWLKNAQDNINKIETIIGDGQTTSWDLGYPVQTINSMSLDGYTVSFAPKGQIGADFYYEIGKTTITADPSTRLLGGLDSLVVDYVGLVSIIVQMRHTKSKLKRAALENNSGIVELIQDATGLDKQGALQLAIGLLNEFTQTGRSIQFTTIKPGLSPGMLLSMFLQQFGLFDDVLVITDVQITWQKTIQSGVVIIQPFFQITCVEGAIVGDWTRMFTRLGKS